jgi:hypothetical protein
VKADNLSILVAPSSKSDLAAHKTSTRFSAMFCAIQHFLTLWQIEQIETMTVAF